MFQTLLFCVPKKKVLHMYEGAKMTELFFLFIVYPIKISEVTSIWLSNHQ